jgi:hypothetical protein
VADQTTAPNAGNLYVGWTQWTLKDSEILFSRSTDDGKTWSKPVEIDNHPGLPRDDNGALEGFAGAVGPDGTLYVAWSTTTCNCRRLATAESPSPVFAISSKLRQSSDRVDD